LWKNLVVDARSSLAGWVGLLIVPPILVWIVSVYVGDADVQGFLQFFIPAFVYLFSLSTLQRIRGELKQANIVKSMPIAGARMIFSWVIHIWMGLCAVVAMIALSIVAFVDPAARAWLDICVVAPSPPGLLELPP
jgi:hypothetical protein